MREHSSNDLAPWHVSQLEGEVHAVIGTQTPQFPQQNQCAGPPGADMTTVRETAPVMTVNVD
jgi:hypothetical protein